MNKKWIVENSEEGLFNKLDELKDSKELLIEMKKKLLTYHYDNETILNKYDELFND